MPYVRRIKSVRTDAQVTRRRPKVVSTAAAMSGEVVLRNNLRNVSRALRSDIPATTHVGHCRWHFGLCSRHLGGADVARKERGQAGSK